MCHNRLAPSYRLPLAAAWMLLFAGATLASAQEGATPINYRVTAATQRLEMVVNTSRILTLDQDVPRVFVSNPDLVRATPLSTNQIQISALQPGVTQVNMWDAEERVFTVDVVVRPDARELEDLLRTEFPEASLKLRPLSQSVVVSGNVPTPEMVSRIVTVAR
ncbi:MAG: pilus assembly protein N-terminal domain-containing protein, partial [Planctomycetes bacterium]|nr:pilus assembly protein N-terminal domain-containing protein [Planctomycetota bacterium]